ncbi:MAG TPA: N-formylglutamate deformylase [Burkholderiaceae bacterium]|nr:N-formylglutamate deformylase [Burkholderiaceae bacterium]
MEAFRHRPGATPLLVSIPHAGTHVPDELLARMTPAARALPDTDWHLERLYDFLDAIGVSVLAATHSRYVVDLNRPPDDANLYPGRDTTGIVPLDTFALEPIYIEGAEPDDAERRHRIDRYWRPYHDRLAQALVELQARHGVALLWDAHSIASVVPRFFEGRLPDLNLGTADGRSCDPRIGARLLALAQRSGYSAVLNGRFKGGYITRQYGRPGDGVHAVQLELSEATYMDEHAPYAFRDELAERIRPTLRAMLDALLEFGA